VCDTENGGSGKGDEISDMEMLEKYTLTGGEEVRIWASRRRGSYLYEALPDFPGDMNEVVSLQKKFLSSAKKLKEGEKEEFLRSWVKDLGGKDGQLHIDGELVSYYLASRLFGYWRINVPMNDPNIEDISCGGFSRPVYVFHKKYGTMETNISFHSEDELREFITRIVERSGAHISVSRPIVECSLPDGSRLQATYGREITKNGSTFAIRKFLKEILTPLDLIRNGTVDVDAAAYIWEAIEGGMSSFIVGGTATGKTTTLNSLLLFIPSNRKIITIEDTREIDIPHSDWIPLYTRQGKGKVNPVTGERAGDIGMYDLLITSLRQRADYIVIGEVRGREAETVFQAMSSGQPAMATFHSNDMKSFIHRLEGSPIGIPKPLISSLDLVIFQRLVNMESGISRKIIEIDEMEDYQEGQEDIVFHPVFRFEDGKMNYSGESRVARKIAMKSKIGIRDVEKEIERKRNFLLEILGRGRMNPDVFLNTIDSFYSRKVV